MNVNIEKALAILQEEDGLEWFVLDEKSDEPIIYEGDKEKERNNWELYCDDAEDEEEGSSLSFEDWLELQELIVDVEEYDEDDYDQKYKVYTDSEADDAWEIELENYIEDCIFPEIPERYRNYFDCESWKKDAKYDGRGVSIGRYDHNEREQTVNGTTYYLYRIN